MFLLLIDKIREEPYPNPTGSRPTTYSPVGRNTNRSQNNSETHEVHCVVGWDSQHMHVICSFTFIYICVHVWSHYRKVKRVYDVYRHIFSVRRVCVEYSSYVLSARSVSSNKGFRQSRAVHFRLSLSGDIFSSRCHHDTCHGSVWRKKKRKEIVVD